MERIPGFIGMALLGAASLALGGCQGDAPAAASGADETEVFTRADDLPQFELQPMSLDELGDFEPEGDKTCQFAIHPAARPLLVATGWFRRPQARVDVLVKYGDAVQQGTSTTPGGFDAIRQEGTFDTTGMVIDVARVAMEPDGSGPARPNRAMLRMRMAGQEPAIIAGFWVCSV